jgi:hypothetical protein
MLVYERIYSQYCCSNEEVDQTCKVREDILLNGGVQGCRALLCYSLCYSVTAYGRECMDHD